MFILQGKETKAEIREQEEIELVLAAFESNGYKALLRGMLRAGCEAIDLARPTINISSLSTERRIYRGTAENLSPIGDILFRDNRLFLIYPQRTRLSTWEIRHHSTDSALETFLEQTESGIKARLDGRRVRGMSFNWKEPKYPVRRPYIKFDRFRQEKLEMKEPEYSDQQLERARLLISENNRSFVLNLAKIGKARSIDAASISDESTTVPLLEKGLIRKEYLISCRQDSHTLASIPDKNQLESSIGSGFRCPTCGRTFREELIQEIFALTEEGKFLLDRSNWMMIWITNLLLSSGIPVDKIKWNAAAGDDELDIVIDVLGLQVFLELKDREFGLGDAYPFGFRLQRYNGDFGVVVTMDKVASEAKKFFKEQASRRTGQIETLEGQVEIENNMPKLIDKISRYAVQMFVSQVSEEAGLSLLPFVKAWMNQVRKDSGGDPQGVLK